MKSRACILATHHTQLAIPHCDYAAFLEKGQVKGQGTAEELVSAGLIGADVIVGRVEAPLTAARDDKSSRLVDVHSPSDELSSRGSLDTEFPLLPTVCRTPSLTTRKTSSPAPFPGLSSGPISHPWVLNGTGQLFSLYLPRNSWLLWGRTCGLKSGRVSMTTWRQSLPPLRKQDQPIY
jgi:hypothetical protein